MEKIEIGGKCKKFLKIQKTVMENNVTKKRSGALRQGAGPDHHPINR